MMTHFYRITCVLGLLATLAGCSLFGKDEPEYLASIEVEPLKIPQGLDTPRGEAPIVISAPTMGLPQGDQLNQMPPLVTHTSERRDGKLYMSWSAEGVFLMVKDTPESVAARLAIAIGQEGMTMLEESPLGAHKFHYSQPQAEDKGFFSNLAFWRDGPVNYSGTFMTRLKADGEDTRVYLLFGNGETVDTAGSEHVLAELMRRLG